MRIGEPAVITFVVPSGIDFIASVDSGGRILLHKSTVISVQENHPSLGQDPWVVLSFLVLARIFAMSLYHGVLEVL